MRDYNYFSLIKRRKKQGSKSRKAPDSFMIILLVVGLLAAGVWPAITQARLFFLDYQINLYSQTLTQDSRYPLFQAVEQKQYELANGQSIVSSMQQASNVIYSKEVINEKLLHGISAVLPSDTHLTSLTLSGQNISMSGVARSRAAVAELLYNLRNTGQFGQQLFINSLSESNGFYPFSLSLELTGGGFR